MAVLIDASALVHMDVRYIYDDRGVEQLTITTLKLEQIDLLTNFVRALENEKRASNASTAPAELRRLLEID